MALIHCNFISLALHKQTAVTVIIPTAELSFEGNKMIEKANWRCDKKFKSLYLYHGWSDDSTCWQRFTSIERYAQVHNIAIVMPDAEHSYYVNMKEGPQFGKYLYEELPTVMQSLFPLSDRREDNFVAGLSMGGYGALYAALTHPRQFSAAASMSGVTDIVKALECKEDSYSHFERIFGAVDKVPGSKYDLHYLLHELKERNELLPRLYITCGDRDTELLNTGKEFTELARKEGYDVTEIVGKGTHEWAVWDVAIQDILDWLE